MVGGCDVRSLESIHSKVWLFLLVLQTRRRQPSENMSRIFFFFFRKKGIKNEPIRASAATGHLIGGLVESREDTKKTLSMRRALSSVSSSSFLMSSYFNKSATHVAFMLISSLQQPPPPLFLRGSSQLLPCFFFFFWNPEINSKTLSLHFWSSHSRVCCEHLRKLFVDVKAVCSSPTHASQ